ncbi:telomere repeat-binding factor 2 isoform X1 [Ziziphus jujuba]|uniref:MYB transcription factor n=2 Tax=Ziziphus jujuba TaxID=326968 RepID=A0ABM3IUR7_ZIZJJ|nr:telomere repeat-binding factor 2 isoform X1 [Ziziphus jujuba]XP_048335790.2 telomere repeat-binding factor 2 isoform X1 [Ziziphus jujuba]
MGAPKQKWTAEEEAALKAGVIKHGAGKWRTILTDPEFSSILHLRSNVDLKDKWRNINVTAIWGSRQKAKLALKRNPSTAKNENNPLAVATVLPNDEEVVDAKPLAVSDVPLRITNSKEPVARLDNLILDAIINLKEPRGSDRAAIALYIEEQYWAPPNLKKLLSTKLKHMTANGKLIKVKHRYRIAPSSTSSEKRRSSSMLLLEGRKKDTLRAEKSDLNILTKSQIDAELTEMRSMTPQEAAAAAARAVAEAEAAIAAAEEAAREAEEAEAEAEAAQVFAQAAMKALKCRTLHTRLRAWTVTNSQNEKGVISLLVFMIIFPSSLTENSTTFAVPVFYITEGFMDLYKIILQNLILVLILDFL